MKRIYLLLLTSANFIMVGLLSLLGFSCSDDNMVVEYGTPHAVFQIKGKVVDTKGNPIPGVRIRINQDSKMVSYPWMQTDMIKTNTDGEFYWEKGDFPIDGYRFITEDTDGEKNGGLFASDTTFVSFKSDDFTGKDGWFEGYAHKEIKITLKDYIDPHTEPYSLYTIYGQVKDTEGNPLAGVLILTSPAYTPNTGEDLSNYPAITDITGRYQFTYDKATATEHTIYTQLYSSYWNDQNACTSDSIVVNFGEIELTKGKGMLIGKGSKEVNFQLTRKN